MKTNSDNTLKSHVKKIAKLSQTIGPSLRKMKMSRDELSMSDVLFRINLHHKIHLFKVKIVSVRDEM